MFRFIRDRLQKRIDSKQLEFQCNCLFWVWKKMFLYGGSIKFKRSKTWFGFHTVWVSPWGTEYEYTVLHPKRQKWWYIPFCYRGVIKEIKKREKNGLQNKK